MRLLADENVHGIVIQRLRAAGFDVEAVVETGSGSSDASILDRPDIGELVLITYDRDFGELIFKQGMPAPPVLIYSRLGRAEPRHVADRITEILGRPPVARQCYVIEKAGERARPFSAGTLSDA